MWLLSGFADEIDDDPRTQCAVLRELGIGHLELRSAWDRNVVDLTDADLTRLEEILAAHEMQVSSIGSPIGKISVTDPFGPHVATLDRVLEVANRLGAPFVRVFSFFVDPTRSHADQREEVITRLSVMAEHAAAAGVVLLHENEKEIYGDLPERVLDLVTTVDSPALRLAWDAANYVQCGVRPYPEAYRMLRPYTQYIQIKDAVLATGEVVVAGAGDGGIRETVRALRADGFDGFFSMEPHLAAGHRLGGFSGPDNFVRATQAFVEILDAEGIEHR